MKANRDHARITDKRWFVPKRWLRPLRAVALSILLGLSVASSAAHAICTPTSTSQPRPHVYLIRGLLSVFFSGMDEIAAKLQQQGINATVHHPLAWPHLAEKVAAKYKSGRVRTIILVGHSAGAAAVTSMAARLGELGVPVKLVIGLDPIWHTAASGHVGRFVNYYISNGAGMAVDRSRQFSGVLQNIDVKKIPDIGHFNIDTNQTLQQRMIWEIRAAIYADCNAAPTSPVSTLQIGAGSVKSPDGGRLARRLSGVLPPRPPLEGAAEIDPSRRLAARLRCNATRAPCSYPDL